MFHNVANAWTQIVHQAASKTELPHATLPSSSLQNTCCARRSNGHHKSNEKCHQKALQISPYPTKSNSNHHVYHNALTRRSSTSSCSHTPWKDVIQSAMNDFARGTKKRNDAINKPEQSKEDKIQMDSKFSLDPNDDTEPPQFYKSNWVVLGTFSSI